MSFFYNTITFIVKKFLTKLYTFYMEILFLLKITTQKSNNIILISKFVLHLKIEINYKVSPTLQIVKQNTMFKNINII